MSAAWPQTPARVNSGMSFSVLSMWVSILSFQKVGETFAYILKFGTNVEIDRQFADIGNVNVIVAIIVVYIHILIILK